MRLQKNKFHFIGIGGIGMCGLAEILQKLGAEVSGSDLGENANTEHLREMGVKIYKGHNASNVGDVDVVVYSSAIPANNPEMLEARARQVPMIARAEALAEIMRLKRGVAVAGTHGKTTTTSMVASIFLAAESKPTISVGGRFDLIKSTAQLGDGEWMIAEADESDGSFLKLSPEISIITNIDSDHLDYYKTFENLKATYLQFAHRIPFYGVAIYCGDDPALKEIFQNFPKRHLSYGFEKNNDYQIVGENSQYQIFYSDKKVGSFELNVPGQHNALNAAAAFIAGLQAGFSSEVCSKGLKSFLGVDRRFQFKGEKKQIKVYDDYGHHPTEVRATLQGFREKFPQNRLVVYFQPHRYSRTQSCWQEFTQCFIQCDVLFLTDIYAAGESPIPGIDSKTLTEQIQQSNKSYLGVASDSRIESEARQILPYLKSGDIFITLGAGDGWKVGLEVLKTI